jgi:hypothetical protein
MTALTAEKIAVLADGEREGQIAAPASGGPA